MNIGKALAIIRHLDDERWDLQEKGQAIWNVMNMDTMNSITKAELLNIIKWLWNLIFEVPPTFTLIKGGKDGMANDSV